VSLDNQPWCVLLAGRESVQRPRIAPEVAGPGTRSTNTRDPLMDSLQRAANVASRDRIAAVVPGSELQWRRGGFRTLEPANVLGQPTYRGTAYEVLRALLEFEARVDPSTPFLFLPSDHVVSEEAVMTHALLGMIDWIRGEPGSVFLLGAVPEEPHDQLGYIVPWNDARQVPSSVYEFVEKPDIRQARKLINAGGLWNTFIFGGTLSSMISLFQPTFAAAIAGFRAATRAQNSGRIETDALTALYGNFSAADFSQDVLAKQPDRLKVVSLPRCGWWPLKLPKSTESPDYARPTAENRETDQQDGAPDYPPTK
jgi:mannose-1-phosphate guanylyltransferase